ncbi:unnamed protein product [Parnassius apollo]|uniref:(apollo) hypothetical protein n=1 Tax=Parnassius apollo TaxID=110799 RepID=A0A8S3WUH0_PARAO|nr:unnamed protein product [Parnassius apollo]
MDDGIRKNAQKGRCLEVARARLELALDATACEPQAERDVLHDHPAAPRIHHPHQLVWCQQGQGQGPAIGNRHWWSTPHALDNPDEQQRIAVVF